MSFVELVRAAAFKLMLGKLGGTPAVAEPACEELRLLWAGATVEELAEAAAYCAQEYGVGLDGILPHFQHSQESACNTDEWFLWHLRRSPG